MIFFNNFLFHLTYIFKNKLLDQQNFGFKTKPLKKPYTFYLEKRHHFKYIYTSNVNNIIKN